MWNHKDLYNRIQDQPGTLTVKNANTKKKKNQQMENSNTAKFFTHSKRKLQITKTHFGNIANNTNLELEHQCKIYRTLI